MFPPGIGPFAALGFIDAGVARRPAELGADFRGVDRVGRAALAEGGVMATPAIAGRAIFLRTESHLYRIEKRP